MAKHPGSHTRKKRARGTASAQPLAPKIKGKKKRGTLREGQRQSNIPRLKGPKGARKKKGK